MAQLIPLRAETPPRGVWLLVVYEFPADGKFPPRSVWAVDHYMGTVFDAPDVRAFKFPRLAQIVQAEPRGYGARVTYWARAEEFELTDMKADMPRSGEYVLCRVELATPGEGAQAAEPFAWCVDRWMGGPEPFEQLAALKLARTVPPAARVTRWARLPAMPVIAMA